MDDDGTGESVECTVRNGRKQVMIGHLDASVCIWTDAQPLMAI